MSSESNKQIVTNFINRVFVELDSDAVDELVADDFESHSWPAHGNGRDSLREATARMATALADIEFTIDDVIAEGDRVCARVTSRARQVGDFMGMPASNRSYEVGEIHIFRLRDGRIFEHWMEMDALGLMRQLKPDGTP